MWVVYMLRLRDNGIYCGITNDFIKRLLAHSKGCGSKYVASRLPITDKIVVYSGTKSDALKAEAKIKSWTKEQKEELWAGAIISTKIKWSVYIFSFKDGSYLVGALDSTYRVGQPSAWEKFSKEVWRENQVVCSRIITTICGEGAEAKALNLANLIKQDPDKRKWL